MIFLIVVNQWMDIMWKAVAEENSFRISCDLMQDEAQFHCLNFLDRL